MLFNQQLLGRATSARLDLSMTLAAGFLGGIVLLAQAFYLSRVINQVFLQQATLTDVSALLWLLFALSVIRAALAWLSQTAAQRVAGRVKTDLRDRLIAHLTQLGPAFTRTQQSGELTNTVVEGIESLDAYFSQYLPQLVLAVLIPFSILVFVFPLDFTSGLILLVTAPLIPIFMILIGSAADSLSQRQWLSLSRMSAQFLDALQGLTTLKLLGRSRQQIETIAQLSDQFRLATMEVLRVAFLSALVLELVATLSTAIVAVEVGLRLLYGHLEFEQALLVLILAPEFYLPLRLLGTRFHAGVSGVTAARRIFEVLNTPLPADKIPALPLEDGGRGVRGKSFSRLVFKNVYYTYPDDRRPALNNVSLTINAGETVALVGASGAGKSTIAHLLLHFVEPSAGQIVLDDVLLSEIQPADWRKVIAWVPQMPYLFNDTVAQNIALACPDATLAQIKEAAHLARADDFIAALPHDYNTIIGERGSRLSGGQAQRIALARAFLKNAPFLILDEATANLDPAHETQIQAAIADLRVGRTTLIIAHRLKTVTTADRIVVLHGGQVVQTGTHPELLAQPGLYREMQMVISR